jgi:hypothetical protein
MDERLYKVHPAIGVARLGNAPASPDGFFIGPETPGVPANYDFQSGRVRSFKVNGRVKRQAARFRVFEYVRQGGEWVLRREVTLGEADVVQIGWAVYLANRKASFFRFDGQTGATDDFASADRRNPKVPDEDRPALLEIDEGPRWIAGASASGVEFKNTKAHIPIETLGELRTDERGRLLVLGGKGQSGTSSTLPPPAGRMSYANNDTWFDDVSDGPVLARVTLRMPDGSTRSFDAESGWVLVGPPDFAPAIRNVITLHDTLLDIAVRELDLPSDDPLFQMKCAFDPASGTLSGYRPSFTREVYPLLRAAADMGWVHGPVQLWHRLIAPHTWASLAEIPGDQAMRNMIFRRMRPPASAEPMLKGMPRLWGDDYDLDDAPTRFASLTQLQYAILKQWHQGEFEADFRGPPATPTAPAITPAGLDQAALEGCVGGAFFPGIEVSWLVRKKEIYAAPFRVNVGARTGPLEVRAGFFSQQMALPWQADFFACAKETSDDNVTAGWWPAQRPDDVFLKAGDESVEWARGMEEFEDMIQRWASRGFVVPVGDAQLEKDGPR